MNKEKDITEMTYEESRAYLIEKYAEAEKKIASMTPEEKAKFEKSVAYFAAQWDSSPPTL